MGANELRIVFITPFAQLHERCYLQNRLKICIEVSMVGEVEICVSALKCIYDFQTLITATLAIPAAILSAGIVWKAAKLPVETQNEQVRQNKERQKNYVLQVLAFDLRLLSTRAKHAQGTMKVHIAANKEVTENTRWKTTLKIHPIAENWECMSLLSPSLLSEYMHLRRLVEDHNFDMARAGGVFGDDNFKRHVLSQAKNLQQIAFALSNKFTGEANGFRDEV